MKSVAHLSELLPFLSQLNAAPQKALSQNFMIDANIVRKMADKAEIQKGDRVLEIGPGPGALTQELLQRGAQVLAIEKDRIFAAALNRLNELGSLTIHQEDVLDPSLLEILKNFQPHKVIANLPYHITTPILELLCAHFSSCSLALLMVQKELAQRLVARPRTKEIGSFTIFLASYAKTSIAFPVSKTCFYPAPEVDSSVIKLEFITPRLPDLQSFHSFVQKAFQQRRKMLRSTLGIAGPYATCRPEDISWEEWFNLYLSESKSCPQ